MVPVSRAVNSVRNDGPHLVEPVELDAPPRPAAVETPGRPAQGTLFDRP
jgi:hypothetical protein